MPITASSAQQLPQSVQFGQRVLRTPVTVTASAPTPAPTDVFADNWSLSVAQSGTLADDTVFTLSGQINGSTFYTLCWPGTTTPITLTGVQIKAGAGAGVVLQVNIKVNQARLAMSTVGSTTGANGAAWRILD